MSEGAVERPKSRLRAWFRGGFNPDPISALDWTLMRAAFAALVLATFWDRHPYAFSGQPSPVGIARWVDLTFLGHDASRGVMLGLACVCCAAYAAGFALRLVLPLLTSAQVALYTFQNSQGFTDHGVQLVSMVLLFQTIVVWWKRGETADKLRAWLWFYSRGIILFSYVASALTKFINTRGLWIWRSKHLCIEAVKTRRYSYYKDLDPALLGDPPAAMWLLQHPAAAQVVFGIGFFIEALAFLGLRDRRWSALAGLTIIAMHQGIIWIMDLAFVNHQWLCLIFLVNPAGWLLILLRKGQTGPLNPMARPSH